MVRSVVIGLSLAATFGIGWQDARDTKDAFEAQLRLARAAGFATTHAEYAAGLPKVTGSDNAAPFYLPSEPRKISSDAGLHLEVLAEEPSGENLAKAKDYLTRQRDRLTQIELAVQKPYCRFDRDWRDGAAVLLAEYSQMRQAAQLLMLRGVVAAAEGRQEAAIRDIDRTRVVARHLEGESMAVPTLIAISIRASGLRLLAEWSLPEDSRQAYLDALRKSLDDAPRDVLRARWNDELCNLLSTIDLCSTEKGRAKLGLTEDEVAPGEGLFANLIDPWTARSNLVAAYLAVWKSLDEPLEVRLRVFDAHEPAMTKAMLSFLTASKLVDPSSLRNTLALRERWISQLRQWEVVHRALTQTPIPESMPLSDIVSPFDGKPLGYQFDGKQIVVIDGGAKFAEFRPRPLSLAVQSRVR